MLELSHKKLDVYKMSVELVKEVYKATRVWPREELFVLTSQIRRAAISVSSNISEGASRISKAEKKRFYEISRSSLVELDNQLEISLMLEYHKKEDIRELEKLVESIFRMLSKMIENIKLNPLATS